MFTSTLFYYSFFFTLAITLGGLFSGFALKNPIATALFLPVPLTLLFEAIRNVALRQYRRVQDSVTPAPEPVIRTTAFTAFDLRYFFAQRNPLFLATLTLYVIVFTVALLRTGTTYLPSPPLISPIPQSQLLTSQAGY